jgi:hypothetical protein
MSFLYSRGVHPLYFLNVRETFARSRNPKKIEKKHKNKYDLNEILSMLLYTRILYPGSKQSSLEDAKRLIEQPSADIHQVYRALSLLATEFNKQSQDVFKNPYQSLSHRLNCAYLVPAIYELNKETG